MNLAVLAPQWMTFALLALLALAAAEDAVRLRISNLISLAVLLLGIGAMWAVGFRLSLWENLLVLAAVLAVGTWLFSSGRMGGGDIKLFAATGLWFDLEGALLLLVSVALAGGLLALFILAIRMVSWSEGAKERVLVLRPKGGIPYGIAIAAGAALAVMVAQAAATTADPLTNWSAVPKAR
ncbi:prepilin peptidase [Sphingomonas sp. GCM10030256]|uniref:prepilin peptidase n=1 Tax=Sphingomonas sp. GCM10030256 TaxID=3273427 RepID=UPI0036062C61